MQENTRNQKLIQKPTLEMLSEITEYAESTLEKCGVPMAAIAKMNIALDEIYSNIVKFSGATVVKIICGTQNGDTAYLIFTDDGLPYDPLKLEKPDVTLSAEERNNGGLGFFIVKKLMTDITYEFVNGNNTLTVKLKY